MLTSSGSRITCSCTGACSWGMITGLSGLRNACAILRVRSISFFQPNILLMTFMSPNRLVMTRWFGLPLTLLKITGQPPSRCFCSPVTSRSGSTGLSVSIKSPCDFSHSSVFRKSMTSAVSDWGFSLCSAFCMTSELQCSRKLLAWRLLRQPAENHYLSKYFRISCFVGNEKRQRLGHNAAIKGGLTGAVAAGLRGKALGHHDYRTRPADWRFSRGAPCDVARHIGRGVDRTQRTCFTPATGWRPSGFRSRIRSIPAKSRPTRALRRRWRRIIRILH